MARILIIILSFLPRRLPVGLTEFNLWADRIVNQVGPIADKDSMLFALASILIHADARHGYLPDKYFADRLVKSAANQVASQVFQNIKTKQAEEQAKQQAAATAQPESTTTDGTKGQA